MNYLSSCKKPMTWTFYASPNVPKIMYNVGDMNVNAQITINKKIIQM